MNKATDFLKGDHVIMTEEGMDNGIQGPKHRIRGVVTGLSRCRKFVRVKREGCKRSEAYQPRFWKRL